MKLPVFVIVVSAALLAIFSGIKQGHPKYAVDLPTFPAYSLDGSDAIATAVIRNTGTTELEYRIEPSCQCTSISPRSGRIAGGGQSEITIKIPPLKSAKATRTVNLSVETNDPENRLSLFAVGAALKIPWEGDVRNISFGSSTPSMFRPSVEYFDLKSIGEDVQPVVNCNEKDTVFSCNVHKVGSRTWRVSVSTKSETPLGQYYTKYRLGSIAFPNILEFSVFQKLTSDVSCIPSFIMIPKGVVHEADLVLYSKSIPLIRDDISIAEVAGVEILGATQDSTSRVRLKLRFSPDSIATSPYRLTIRASESCALELPCIRTPALRTIDAQWERFNECLYAFRCSCVRNLQLLPRRFAGACLAERKGSSTL